MTVETLKKELDDFTKSMSERIEALKNRPQFEKGKWYKHKSVPAIARYGGDDDSFGISHGEWFPTVYWFKTDPESFIPMSDSEVQEALTKEAIKRGYKKGVTLKYPWYSDPNSFTPFFNGSTIYNTFHDLLQIEGVVVYKNGQWAEIVSEPEIKIGGYTVGFSAGSHHCGTEIKPAGKYTIINRIALGRDFWEAAKVTLSNRAAHLLLRIEFEDFELDLSTINSILQKLK